MLNETRTNQAPKQGETLAKAAERAAEWLGISGGALAEILGTSQFHVSHFKAGTAAIDIPSKASEPAALFLRAVRSLEVLTGGNQGAARVWLNSQNSALGATPADLLATAQGLADVVGYLDARIGRV